MEGSGVRKELCESGKVLLAFLGLTCMWQVKKS